LSWRNSSCGITPSPLLRNISTPRRTISAPGCSSRRRRGLGIISAYNSPRLASFPRAGKFPERALLYFPASVLRKWRESRARLTTAFGIDIRPLPSIMRTDNQQSSGNRPGALKRFEHVYCEVLRARFGGRWKLERLDVPPPAPHREIGRLAVPADEGAVADLGGSSTGRRSPHEHAIED